MGSLTGIESVTRFSKYDFTVFLDELASFDRQSDKELLLKRWTTVGEYCAVKGSNLLVRSFFKRIVQTFETDSI